MLNATPRIITYMSVALIDAVDVDFGQKSQQWWLIGIRFAAVQLQRVYSVLVWSLYTAKKGSADVMLYIC